MQYNGQLARVLSPVAQCLCMRSMQGPTYKFHPQGGS
uniref:Uncharacterized protein n=1 Tax=Arundo donax TaxID=35708 RepID=A0A0A9GM98_ARUDO